MKSLLLTEQEDQTLRMFLLMTTNYRRDEQESCARLATETDDDGTLTFPKMSNNAQWWQGCIDTIDAITEKMGVRGGGLPLEAAEDELYTYYKNSHDYGAVMIECERLFYSGMLRMLELLGGHCKVSEYGSHTISFADEPMQQEATIDPADSQQSQAGVLTYGATKADIKAAQSELSNKMCSTVAQRNNFLGNDTDSLKGKSDEELFKLLNE